MYDKTVWKEHVLAASVPSKDNISYFIVFDIPCHPLIRVHYLFPQRY